MSATPQISQISEADFPAIAAFAAARTRAGEPVAEGALSPEERLRWVILENPARSPEIPFGWCTREGERIVGMLLCVPFRIGIGEFSCTALMASKFYADPEYRSAGIGPLMRFLQLAASFPLLMTSANAVAGELYQKCGAYMIKGMDHTLLGVARPGPLVEEWIARRVKAPLAARLVALPARLVRRRIGRRSEVGELIPLQSPQEATSSPWPSPRDALTVLRNPDYIRWRYFGRETGKDVYCLSLSGSEDRLVVVQLVRSGHRSQIRVLDVLDVWPPADPQAATALVTHLSNRYSGKFDVLWLRSQPSETEQSLTERGFLRHAFPAPMGWCMDRGQRLPTRHWYLMPGEAE